MIKVSFFLGDLGLGGVERVLLNYANELSARGFIVTFVVAKGGGAIENDLSIKVNLIRFGESRVRKSWPKLWSYIHKEKPDYIITGGDSANIMVIIASMFSNTKVIVTQHNYNDIEASKQGIWSNYLHIMMKILYPRAYKICAVSNGIAGYLTDIVGIKRDRVEVLLNPLDLKDLRNRAMEEPEFELPEKFILFVGRISPVKNLSLLINAYEKSNIEDASLVIVGDGTELDNLKSLSGKMSKRNKIIFTGLSHNPISIIKKCSTLVLCSFSEAMPTVLLEAMAFDKPIAATPTPGAKEVLACREGSFISKNFDDIDEFANILERSIQCQNSGLSKYAEQYDMETIMKQLIGMLK